MYYHIFGTGVDVLIIGKEHDYVSKYLPLYRELQRRSMIMIIDNEVRNVEHCLALMLYQVYTSVYMILSQGGEQTVGTLQERSTDAASGSASYCLLRDKTLTSSGYLPTNSASRHAPPLNITRASLTFQRPDP